MGSIPSPVTSEAPSRRADAEEYLDSLSGRPNAGERKEKAVFRGHSGGTMGRVIPWDGASEMAHGLSVRVFSPRSLANGS